MRSVLRDMREFVQKCPVPLNVPVSLFTAPTHTFTHRSSTTWLELRSAQLLPPRRISAPSAPIRKVGMTIAERAKAKGIEDVVFDRGGYIYHGRVSELAAGAREGGLKF